MARPSLLIRRFRVQVPRAYKQKPLILQRKLKVRGFFVFELRCFHVTAMSREPSIKPGQAITQPS